MRVGFHPLSPRSVVNHSLFALRDRASPLMSVARDALNPRTSPLYANYETRGQELEAIEEELVRELKGYKNQLFVLFGYNDANNMIDDYKVVIHPETISTTQ